jgi:chemotaxis protein MotA
MTPSPILALLTGVGMILLGNYLEGGHIDSLIQPTAALIVLGGTVGATWLASTDDEIKLLFRMIPRVVRPGLPDRKLLLEQLLKVAGVVRRDGVLAVEAMLPEIQDEFMKRGLRVMVDGYSAQDLRKLMELDMDLTEHHGNAAAKIFETAGGFCPTVGILGAVLGLIHVMNNLSDPSALGPGIAVAFVATIYGVGAANLVFLPLGSRLKKIVGAEVEAKNMVLTGLKVIANGSNPRQVEEMVTAFVGHHGANHDQAKEAA